MKNLLIIFVILLFNSLNIFAQKTITIGILVDQYSESTEPLISKLKEDVIAVSGSEANIIFKGILQNNFDLDEANSNYQNLVESNTDIILSFGTVNSLMLIQKDKFPKPTIVFGALSTDLLEFNDTQKTSGINNITFIISPFSYKEDLNVFKDLYDFKKIGVLIDEHLFSTTYLTKIFDDYFSKIDASFTFIPINAEKMTNSFDDVDAVYLIGGFHLSNVERLKLINEINSRKLPSFTSLGVNLVEEGILATNKPKSNIEMFSRRIALSVEAIITGENAANLPLFIDYKSILTINYNVANLINFPLRYSLVAKADFVGSKNKRPTTNALSVVDVMNAVLNKNLGLASEKKNIEISEQNIRNAKSSYVPQLNASIRGSYFDPKSALLSQGQNAEITTVGNLTLNQTIYSETNQANIFNQKELQKAQIQTYNKAELDAVLNASIAYLNALIFKTNAVIQNQNLQVTKKNLHLAEQNFEAGASGKSDVLRFRSQLAQNSQSLIVAENKLYQGFNLINQLMNNPLSMEIDIEDTDLDKGVFTEYGYNEFFELLDNPKYKNKLISFLIKEAKENIPELKNLKHNIKIAERNYKLNKGGRFIPTVSIQGQYNYFFSREGEGSSIRIGSISPPDNNYNIGLNIALPILQRNQRNINKQKAEIQKNQFTIQTKNRELSIEKNINDIILELINQISNIEISKVAESTAGESLELTQNSYKEGAVPVIQLIDAQTNYLKAKLDSATAKYNYLISSMKLEREIGYFFLLQSDESNKDFLERALKYIVN